MSGRDQAIITLPFNSANVYAIRSARTVIVDTGLKGMGDAILAGLDKRGVRRDEIALILLTHAHPDHAGSAADLKERLGVPLAVHRAEAGWLRAGRPEGEPIPLRPFGRLLKAVVNPEFPACAPDLLLDEGDALDDYGLDVRLLHTPGHSPGSLSIVLPDGECLAGDLLAGGFVREDRPDYPFFVDDRATLDASIARLLTDTPRRLHFGHGRPASAASARRRFAALLARTGRSDE